MNNLSTRECFLKLKIDNPLISDLSKTATLFLHSQPKLKHLCSWLLQLILKKFYVSIIFPVVVDRMICVSVNPLISLFIILPLLTISPTCFGSDFVL